MSEKQFYICEDEDDIRGNFGEVDKPLSNTEIVDLLNKLAEKNKQLKEEIRAYPINEQYAEEIIQQNQKLRIERNGLRRENEQLKQKYKITIDDKQQAIIKQLKQENKKLNRQLNTQDTINIQYREIITCLEIIIDELNKENRQLHYQIIKLQDKEILDE